MATTHTLNAQAEGEQKTKVMATAIVHQQRQQRNCWIMAQNENESREQYPSLVRNFKNCSLCIRFFPLHFEKLACTNMARRGKNCRRQYSSPSNNLTILLLPWMQYYYYYLSTLQPQHTYPSCKEKAIVRAEKVLRWIEATWCTLHSCWGFILRLTRFIHSKRCWCVPFISFHLRIVFFFSSCHFYVSKQCARS